MLAISVRSGLAAAGGGACFGRGGAGAGAGAGGGGGLATRTGRAGDAIAIAGIISVC